jgi:hypothetical protein
LLSVVVVVASVVVPGWPRNAGGQAVAVVPTFGVVVVAAEAEAVAVEVDWRRRDCVATGGSAPLVWPAVGEATMTADSLGLR